MRLLLGADGVIIGPYILTRQHSNHLKFFKEAVVPMAHSRPSTGHIVPWALVAKSDVCAPLLGSVLRFSDNFLPRVAQALGCAAYWTPLAVYLTLLVRKMTGTLTI